MDSVLLLNPPGEKRYIRDYFCSKVSKSGYLYPPTDLLVQSGLLSRRFRVLVLDAIAEGLDPAACLKRIRTMRPDHLLTLAGAVSLNEDVAFLDAVRREIPSLRSAAALGDLFLEDPAAGLERFRGLDALAVDFTGEDIGNFFAGLPHALATRERPVLPAPARGEFSIVIAALGAGLADGTDLGTVAGTYVLLSAVVGPLAAKHADRLARWAPVTRPRLAP